MIIMPRNTNDREYITVAIRKDSNLMKQLETDVREKSQPKSHLIVSYAADYVRLILRGDKLPPHVNASDVSTPEAKVPEQPAFITSNLTEDDLDVYGD